MKRDAAMGICRRFQLAENHTNIMQLRKYASDTIKTAINNVTPEDTKLTREQERALSKITNKRKNLAALQINDIKLVAHSSVHDNNPYREYFVSNKLKETDVLFVSDNKDINYPEDGHNRCRDSEAKLLFELMKNYRELLEQPNTIYLYTHKQPCLSCDYYIIKFLQEFSNVTIQIYYERPYPDRD